MKPYILVTTFDGPVMAGAEEGVIPDHLRCVRYDDATETPQCCRHPGKPRGFVFCGPENISDGSVVARYRKLYHRKARSMKVSWKFGPKPVWFRRK